MIRKLVDCALETTLFPPRRSIPEEECNCVEG